MLLDHLVVQDQRRGKGEAQKRGVKIDDQIELHSEEAPGRNQDICQVKI